MSVEPSLTELSRALTAAVPNVRAVVRFLIFGMS